MRILGLFILWLAIVLFLTKDIPAMRTQMLIGMGLVLSGFLLLLFLSYLWEKITGKQ